VALSPCLGPNIREVGYLKSGIPIMREVTTINDGVRTASVHVRHCTCRLARSPPHRLGTHPTAIARVDLVRSPLAEVLRPAERSAGSREHEYAFRAYRCIRVFRKCCPNSPARGTGAVRGMLPIVLITARPSRISLIIYGDPSHYITVTTMGSPSPISLHVPSVSCRDHAPTRQIEALALSCILMPYPGPCMGPAGFERKSIEHKGQALCVEQTNITASLRDCR
jgi:hypothetical protein